MFRRLLILLETDGAPGATLDAARRVAPVAEHTRYLIIEPVPADPNAVDKENGGRLQRLRAALLASGVSRQTLEHDTAPLASLEPASIAVELQRNACDLVVIPPLLGHSGRERVNVILGLATEYGVAVLCVGTGAPTGEPALRRVALALEPDTPVRVMRPFIERMEAHQSLVALALRSSAARSSEIAAELTAAASGRDVHIVAVDTARPRLAQAVDEAAVAAGADLVVVASDGISDWTALAFSLFSASALQKTRTPALLLPRTESVPNALRDGLAASDTLVLESHGAPIALERVRLFGAEPLLPAAKISFTGPTGAHPLLGHLAGVVTLPGSWLTDLKDESDFVLHLSDAPASRATVRVVRPSRPLLLVDATLAADFAQAPEPAPGAQVVFVRLRHDEALPELRQNLPTSPWTGVPVLLDASAWLDDVEDVPRGAEAQRLLRLGLRLALDGATIAGVVARNPFSPEAPVFYPFERTVSPRSPESSESALDRELDLVSRAQTVAGHDVAIELDNGVARADMLRALEAATRRIHWQCYIVEDDAISSTFERALCAAAQRGVRVRILVDAVYSRHEAFGSKNPLLVRLEQVPGIEVRAFRPVSGMPGLAALKQRNHRKTVVFDGHTAVITGRNMGAPYYRGFDEVALTPASLYRDVPWLDCGASLRGPLVAAVEQAFLTEWQRAGGDGFDLAEPALAGPLRARFILHDGLLDTRTFDTQLALIRHAREELLLVNTFPLAMELQHALVAAVKRGVRVRVLFGNVRPHFAEGVPFPGGAYRTLADQLVRSRLDAVVNAGGEAWEYALPILPKWDPSLRRVFPHVHAKVLVRDQRDVALGSANLDVTSAYWESEAMLLVHDAAFARTVVATLDSAFASSRRVDASDPVWQSGAPERAWLSRHWPSLIG
jgi:phosphatidylserine/phosphatidylglycerophosphate/cardiolipin synthase-like enzyme/nucleotide-binding universal stress UspA family protein